MTPQEKDARETQIAEAAYALLREKGYGGMSMLAVARKAKASNETLYRWYGDKAGLFRMLITRNVAVVSERLEQVSGERSAQALTELGEVLLELLLSPSAIALNRAAAADASDQLGAVLAEGGRGKVFPRIVRFFNGLSEAGVIRGAPGEVAELWLDLLVGDLQVRCVTGAMPPPGVADRAARAAKAQARVLALFE